ncbi:MAG TPA: hypothetical protein VK585_14215 [Jiangellaceae bacterium]|nr:hypothetical protein [Jiangellaceae bacterium]
MDDPAAAAAQWLLQSGELAVRYLTRRDVLGQDVQPDGGAGLTPPPN